MFTLEVSNFQSIQNIKLEVEGLTVVTAPSHSGKTSLVRAADALLTANWFQEAYMRKGTNLCSIVLTHGTDSITYTRKGSTSSYSINKENFSKLSGNVPPLLNQLGFGEIHIPRSSKEVVSLTPQVQNQFDGPYQDTIDPVAMTQLLGSFTNLAPYQTAQDRARKQQGDVRRELDRSQTSYKKLTSVYSSLAAYTPAYTQEALDTLCRVECNTRTVQTDALSLCSHLAVKEALTSLKSLRQPVSSNVLQCVKVMVTGASLLDSTASTLYGMSTALSVCKDYRESLQTNLAYRVPGVKVFTQASQAFRSQLGTWEKLPQTLQALSEVKRELPEAPSTPSARQIVSSVIMLLTELKTLSSAIDSQEGLLASLKEAKETLESLQSQHDLIETSLVEGKCPLCLNSTTKPKKAKKKLESE